jgi:hypothetical protein
MDKFTKLREKYDLKMKVEMFQQIDMDTKNNKYIKK